jgi:hypothetical protein
VSNALGWGGRGDTSLPLCLNNTNEIKPGRAKPPDTRRLAQAKRSGGSKKAHQPKGNSVTQRPFAGRRPVNRVAAGASAVRRPQAGRGTDCPRRRPPPQAHQGWKPNRRNRSRVRFTTARPGGDENVTYVILNANASHLAYRFPYAGTKRYHDDNSDPVHGRHNSDYDRTRCDIFVQKQTREQRTRQIKHESVDIGMARGHDNLQYCFTYKPVSRGPPLFGPHF